MYLLGYDVGSSSVKASLINAENGRAVASAFYPKKEMKIDAPKAGWAEQDPEEWWALACKAIKRAKKEAIRQKQVRCGQCPVGDF